MDVESYNFLTSPRITISAATGGTRPRCLNLTWSSILVGRRTLLIIRPIVARRAFLELYLEGDRLSFRRRGYDVSIMSRALHNVLPALISMYVHAAGALCDKQATRKYICVYSDTQ